MFEIQVYVTVCWGLCYARDTGILHSLAGFLSIFLLLPYA